MKPRAMKAGGPPPPRGETRAARRTRLGEDYAAELTDEFNSKGGLATFRRMVVLSDAGDLGAWTGYSWKAKRAPDQFFVRIAHDREGSLWCINEKHQVCKLLKSGFKTFGYIGAEDVVDIAFDNENKLWSVSRMGDLLFWSGFDWERKEQSGFHKLRSIAFDRKGALWAVNNNMEIAVWDEEENCWDQKEIPDCVKVHSLDFDLQNKLWIVGHKGQLMLLSGNKWVNYGFVSCWKLRDLSFRGGNATGKAGDKTADAAASPAGPNTPLPPQMAGSGTMKKVD